MLQLMVVYFGPYYLFKIKVGITTVYGRPLSALSSITRHILREYTGAESVHAGWPV